jgi:hypothetical protein
VKKSPTSHSEGIIGLVREAIDGLGDLVGEHLHLVRLELVTDLRSMGRRAQRSLICGLVAFLGYTLAVAGLAVLLGGNRPIGSWLLLFGGVHLLGATAAFLFGRSRESGKKLMDTNLEQVGESIATLQRAVSGPATEANSPPAVPPTTTTSAALPASHEGSALTFADRAQRPMAPAQGGPGR